MFDSFYFEEGVLPDNKESPEEEFQTKDLDCNLDVYHVQKDKSVHKFVYDPDKGIKVEVNESINYPCIEIYSYNFKITPTGMQFYYISIIDNRFVLAVKTHESGYKDVF